MKRKPTRLLLMLLALLLILPHGALAGDPWAHSHWEVHVTHDLNGGQWQPGRTIPPHTMFAEFGSSMDNADLYQERVNPPVKPGAVFRGWSVRFTADADGRVIYDSGDEVWDLNHPFDYYPDNPRVMDCRMTAQWRPAPGGGSSGLPSEILPDGRVLTRPFIAGTEPLPETPPPCDQIISGTTWLTNAMICGIDEGTKVPVYFFPVYNGPVMDWVGLDDPMEYGLYLFDGWVMLYNPKWVEAGGIGFIASDVIAFPGCEE